MLIPTSDLGLFISSTGLPFNKIEYLSVVLNLKKKMEMQGLGGVIAVCLLLSYTTDPVQVCVFFDFFHCYCRTIHRLYLWFVVSKLDTLTVPEEIW